MSWLTGIRFNPLHRGGDIHTILIIAALAGNYVLFQSSS